TMNIDQMAPEGENQWAGVSSYDFGEERIFFGLIGQNTATRYFGIAGFGNDDLSDIEVLAGVTYTLVGMVDFANDLVALWVDPDASDTISSYDSSSVYTSDNWSTALRLASGSMVTWDDLSVGTEFSGVVIPEPATSLLALSALG